MGHGARDTACPVTSRTISPPTIAYRSRTAARRSILATSRFCAVRATGANVTASGARVPAPAVVRACTRVRVRPCTRGYPQARARRVPAGRLDFCAIGLPRVFSGLGADVLRPGLLGGRTAGSPGLVGLRSRDLALINEVGRSNVHPLSIPCAMPGGATPEDTHAKGSEAQIHAPEHRAPRHRSGPGRRGAIDGPGRGHHDPETARRTAQIDPSELGSVLPERRTARHGARPRPRPAREAVDALRRARTSPIRAPKAAPGRRRQGDSGLELPDGRRIAGPGAPERALQRHRPSRRGDTAARGPRREVHEVAPHARDGGRW